MKVSKTNRIQENSRRTVFLILVNVLLIIQAVAFHWELGTMVWVYYIQGLIIVILGICMTKSRFAWIMLLGLMAAFGLLLASETIPSNDLIYSKNGVYVPYEQFIVFKQIDWAIVGLNAIFVSAVQFYSYFKNGVKGQEIASFWEAIERLLPLHLIILFASTGLLPVVGFMILKSVTDIIFDLVTRWALSHQRT